MARYECVLPRECTLQRITKTGVLSARIVLFVLSIAFLGIAVSGCSVTRLVPIQLVRISQTESYTQFFTFSGLEKQTRQGVESQSNNPPLQQMEYIDRVFRHLLGDKNWQNIKDLYGFGELHSELVQGKVYIQGVVNLVLYIDPLEQDHFLIEGLGRYYLVRESNSAILLSGDFHIPLAKHRLDELDSGSLLINVDLYVTRIPEQITYINEVRLIYKLFMDTRMKKEHVYSVDYEKKHTVYLIGDGLHSEPLKSDMIGFMRLHNDNGAVKLIDLRGMQFLRNDYSRHFK